MKNTKLLLIITIMSLFMCVQVSADTLLFSDDFESYTQGILDQNYSGGPNASPNGGPGNPWFGPITSARSFIPNGQITGTYGLYTPHSGNNQLTGNYNSTSGCAVRINIAKRFNNGQPFTGNLQFDWWMRDPNGTGVFYCNDYAALEYYAGAPPDSDFPIDGDGSISSDSNIQRLSLGLWNVAYASSARYQARVVGCKDSNIVGTSGWWNLDTTQRTAAWHHFRILVGPQLPDKTNTVCYFVDDMVKPRLIHNGLCKMGYNLISLNMRQTYSSAHPNDCAAYFDDISLTRTDPAYTSAQINEASVGASIFTDDLYITATGNCLPTDTVYAEPASRSYGIRIHYTGLSSLKPGIGNRIAAVGTVQIASSGEKYIEATGATVSIPSISAPLAVGMNNKAATEARAQGLFIKTWGKVKSVDTDNFVISDGSSADIKVLCGSTITKPSVGDDVRVRGVASKDASGPVLYMRNERVDWTTADATYQALPLPGAYKYPREWLVCGPFTDSSSTDQYYRQTNDYISAATSGTFTEYNIRPKEGDPCGSNTWKRAIARPDKDGTVRFSASSTNSVYYAFIWIWSPVDTTTSIWMGSDDGNSLYVDNSGYNNVFTGTRTVGYGQDGYDSIPLHAGMNPILVKVENVKDTCDFNCLFAPAGLASGAYGTLGMPDLGYSLDYVP